jgi:phosphatidylinositol alpha 1,6-mannosyltransferase
MRIALVSEWFLPAVDGTTTTVKAVADRLIDAGHDVLLIAWCPGDPHGLRAAVAAVDELLLDHYPRAFWRRPDAA